MSRYNKMLKHSYLVLVCLFKCKATNLAPKGLIIHIDLAQYKNFSSKLVNYKQLLDDVFVISETINIEVSAISAG